MAGSAAEVTVYSEIQLPLAGGAVQRTVMDPSPTEVTTSSGVSGVPNGEDGTTGAEADEATPVPTALVATTSKEYEVPLLRPVIVQELEVDSATREVHDRSGAPTTLAV